MRLISILLATVISIPTQAQQTTQSDKALFDTRIDYKWSRFVDFENSQTVEVKSDYNLHIDSAFRLDNNYDFELRVSSRYLSYNGDNVLILRLQKGDWTARYFDRKESTTDGRQFTERKVDQTKLHQLWSLLVQNKILTLPNQETLTNRLIKYEIDTTVFRVTSRKISFTDGVSYSFDLRSPGKIKQYRYDNPEVFWEHFRNVEELARVSFIIHTIQRYLRQTVH